MFFVGQRPPGRLKFSLLDLHSLTAPELHKVPVDYVRLVKLDVAFVVHLHRLSRLELLFGLVCDVKVMRLVFRLTIFVFLDIIIKDLVDFALDSLLDVICLVVLDGLRLLADSLERLIELLLDFVDGRLLKLPLHATGLERRKILGLGLEKRNGLVLLKLGLKFLSCLHRLVKLRARLCDFGLALGLLDLIRFLKLLDLRRNRVFVDDKGFLKGLMQLLKLAHTVVIDDCLLRKNLLDIKIKILVDLLGNLLGLFDRRDLLLHLGSKPRILLHIRHDAFEHLPVFFFHLGFDGLLSHLDRLLTLRLHIGFEREHKRVKVGFLRFIKRDAGVLEHRQQLRVALSDRFQTHSSFYPFA